MDDLVQIIGSTITIAITIAITLFVIISIILFIKDGIASKKGGQGRNNKYTVMFIISMAIVGLVVIIGILLSILAVLVMRSM